MDFYNLERKTKAELFELIQSKQTEIDALQKRIDKAVDYADGTHSENWQETINTMLHILKGESK